jgi:hypothetical protein
LNILGFVINSSKLTKFWSQVYASGLFTLVFVYLNWLTTAKKK